VKSFWIIYSLATLLLLAICYSFLGNFRLYVAVTAGAGAATIWLTFQHQALQRQKHIIPIAFLASVGSVGLGFIFIFLLAWAGSMFH
jgi:hypothetical protein